jgi:hypothetical protein
VVTTLDADEDGVGAAVDNFAVHLQFLEEYFRVILPGIDAQALEYLNNLVVEVYGKKGIGFGSDACRLGQHLHKVFECAKSIDEVNLKIEQMASQSLIASEEASRLKSAIEQAMQNEIVREWFTLDWDDIKSEAEIIMGKSTRRPDRVMIKQGRAVVVDYKFGDIKDSKHNKQVAEYMEILKKMELYDKIEGYIWYITLDEVVKVNDME